MCEDVYRVMRSERRSQVRLHVYSLMKIEEGT